MKIALIMNPAAAGGRAAKLQAPILNQLTNMGHTVDLHMTTRKGHARELIPTLPLGAYDALVCAGGDGTLFETVNGLMQFPPEKRIPLGILPIGTGNAFARDLNVHTGQWEKALSGIMTNHTRPVDVGKVTHNDGSFHFINIVGMGFVADVNALAQKLKWMGNFAYTAGVLVKTLQLRPVPLSINMDGDESSFSGLFAEISNSRYTSNFLMAPQASINDGLLDVTILKHISRRKLLSSFPKIFTGEHIHMEEVITRKAKKIEIRTPAPSLLTPDGELEGFTPITIECIPQALEIFYVDPA